MIGDGTQVRMRFLTAMQQVAVGARLKGRYATFEVVRQKFYATSVMLTLRSGRRTLNLNVGVSIWGPDLAECGLQCVAYAPSQREIFPAEARAA